MPRRTERSQNRSEVVRVDGRNALREGAKFNILEKMPWPNTTGHGMISTAHFHIARTTRVSVEMSLSLPVRGGMEV